MNDVRILFVDDEPHLLSGLRRLLHGQVDWSMKFAGSGNQALAMMAADPVDVIVSDMRMPGVDGGQLLAMVRRDYPSTARMLLSGHADRDRIIAAIGPTQQFLAKPCDADTLVSAISRVLSVRNLVTDQRLRSILGGVDSLPKPPSVHERMLEVSSRPESTLPDIVAVLEGDLALCAEILRLVNSAFFGLSRHVDSVERAASLLGLDTIQALAISGQVFGIGADTPPNLDLAQLRRTGMRSAGYARLLALAEGWSHITVSHAFLTGLLVDLGLLVLAGAEPTGFDQVLAVPADDPWTRSAVELDVFGCTVAEASAYLLGLWGFAEPVVEAMASQPLSAGDPTATPVAHVVNFAHQRARGGPVQAEPSADAWLDKVRRARWNQICDDAAAAFASAE